MTSTDASHHFRLVTTYITDPARDTVLMRTRLEGNTRNLHLYARLDAHVNGNGGGGTQNAGANSGVVDTSTNEQIPVIFSTNTVTNATNRTYAVPTYMALASSPVRPANSAPANNAPANNASVGYAGTASDGLTQLDASHTLTSYTDAPDGHIVATEALTPGRDGQLTLALGFGRTQAQSVSTAGTSLNQSFAQALGQYQQGWAAYDNGLRSPPAHLPGLSGGDSNSTASATITTCPPTS